MATQRSISQMRYDKEKTKHYGMKLNAVTDADIIALLDEVPSFQGFIKWLIRDYIARQQHLTPQNHFSKGGTPMNRVTVESFGDTVPENWQEIAAYLNAKLDALGIPEDGEMPQEAYDQYAAVWERYWNGDYEDAPMPQ